MIADFDGDGKADITVFRPGTGEWFIRYSGLGYAAYPGHGYFQWGLSGDKPMSLDLDGDGKAELIVYRPSSSNWYIRYSAQGYAVNTGNWQIPFGLSGDTPLPNPIR